MSLILAIEPDHRQAERLAQMVRGRLHADLVHAPTTEGALTALAGIGDRVPDLVLVPSLLSAQEDAAIAGALRMIAAAANIRMLTIPVLADQAPGPEPRGVFARLRGRKPQTTPGGCDPALFADQIAAYLTEAAAERRARKADADLVAEDLAAATAPPAETVLAAAPDFVPPPVLEPVIAVVRPADPPREAPVPDPIAAADPPPPVEDPSRPWLIAAPAPVMAAPPEVIAVSAATERIETVEPDALIVPLKPAEPLAPIEPIASSMPTEAAEPLESSELVPPIEPVVLSRAAAAIDDAPAARATDATLTAGTLEPGAGRLAPDLGRLASDNARRRRRGQRPTPPADTFDLDALLAPLLSEIAAKRQEPLAAPPPTVAEAAPLAAAWHVAAPEAPPEAAAVVLTPPREVEAVTAGRDVADVVVIDALAPPADETPAPPVGEGVASPVVERVALPIIESVASPVVESADRWVVEQVAMPVAVEQVAAPVVEPAAFAAAPAPSAPAPAALAVESMIPDVDPMFFAEDDRAVAADPAPGDKPAWVQLIESLRQDIERLKAERAQPQAAAAVSGDRTASDRRTMSIAVTPSTTTPAPDVTAALSKIRRLTPRARTPRPVQDQWGLFDPDQCGFAALRAKLDEISARDEVSA